MFLRALFIGIFTGVFVALVFSAPARAVTAKEKMETCKFGADDQKLTGKDQKDFIRKCMAAGDGPASKSKKKKAGTPAPAQ